MNVACGLCRRISPRRSAELFEGEKTEQEPNYTREQDLASMELTTIIKAGRN